MTSMVLMFAMLALVLVIWVLRRNSQDRDAFEKELDEDLGKDGEAND